MSRTGILRWAAAVSLLATILVWEEGTHSFAERRTTSAQAQPVATVVKQGSNLCRTAERPTPSLVSATVLREVTPADAAAITALLPAPTRAIRYVEIDRALVEGKESPFWQDSGKGRVVLTLPAGGTIAVVIDRSDMLGANRFTSVGHVDGAAESRAVFAYHAGFLSASIELPGVSYALRPATERTAQFYQIDPSLLPPCGGARHPVPDADMIAAVAARRAAAASGLGGTAPPLPASSDAHVVVDLMMLYTQAVKPTLSGAARVAALQSEFDAAVARVNAELAASQVSARVRLVRMAETQYDETASAADSVQNDALTALYKTTDGKMDEIHGLRDQAGADIVCLALNRADSSSIGLSFVLDTPSVSNQSAGLLNPLFAFAVVQYGTIAGTDVVPHELGHVFGCAHARGDPGATGTKDGAFTYSYGYRFFGGDGRQYHDIMAYSPGVGLGYYSNPGVTAPSPISRPLGVNAGQPGESDCALTIERTAFEVANFRLQTLAAPVGTLVNVSTRGFVGTGEQVLIGGFVVTGSQSKRMLLRGAGPALADYGVPNLLANPRLELYQNGVVIAANDNWGAQTGGVTAGDVSSAAFQSGAFSFSPGSLDAALLVTLPAGQYTTILRGVGDGTGSGLVEVYDVDRTGNRIINLSTRGYADVGKEMFGGFVVQGDPGTTKRVLIRALGPTLGRDFGVAGAMNDPTLELHDAAGELLVRNDDWSTGTVAGTASAANDFFPLVKTYGEQHISATGFAPANRREPCIMVDLAPGDYTAIVRPFEDLTRTPPLVAQPGVATIEVYEIAP